MNPRTINIFLLDGDPNGIRVAQISMSTIQAIAFRRNQLPRVRKTFPEIERPGVYILIDPDRNEADQQRAYIGESEGIGARLSTHNSNENSKDSNGFWTDTVVLISKDENLTKSHVRYVESCLIRDASGNPRWTIPNIRTPSGDAGKLPLPDRAAMDEFVDQTKTLVGALGSDLFRETRGPASQLAPLKENMPQPELESPRFFFSGKGFSADMEIGPSGDFIVQAGSKARFRTTPTIERGTTALRSTLLEKGVLREDGNSLLFTSNYSFSSVYAAASTVNGGKVNGRTKWKLPDGSDYADWEASLSENGASEPST